jgi:hypothetical protein
VLADGLDFGVIEVVGSGDAGGQRLGGRLVVLGGVDDCDGAGAVTEGSFSAGAFSPCEGDDGGAGAEGLDRTMAPSVTSLLLTRSARTIALTR